MSSLDGDDHKNKAHYELGLFHYDLNLQIAGFIKNKYKKKIVGSMKKNKFAIYHISKFYKINRGGDITYHGPGQIVGYPILDLDNFFTDIHKYLRFLEEVIILTLNDFGIKGERNPGKTGVWLDCDTPFPRKICAMGVRASRWVTMHGFALNVNVDLKYFDNIIPCGIENNSVTSLNVELGIEKVDIGKVKKKILKNFRELFDATIIH